MNARENAIAGRGCPATYGYSPTVFSRTADLSAGVVYVIGGLYGNGAALREIERMAAHETGRIALVFNGDFHWFDAEPEAFRALDEAVMRHTALRGNVETEIASDDDSYGCGCAYPEDVPDADVDRSNAILARLKAVARHLPDLRARLRALPMHQVVSVGAARIAVVHGDAWSLAGWHFASDALHDPANEQAIADTFEKAAVDGFASSHTCLPALKVYSTALGERFVINNGAAGMANFSSSRHGVISRLAAEPVPEALASCRLYGADCGALFVDALAVHFDTAKWDQQFARLWPPGSAAHTSYARRIARGPDYSVDQALGRVAAPGCITADA